MKFKISKLKFLDVLQLTQSIVEKRNTMPILSNVLLHVKGSTLLIAATDLEIGIQVQITVDVLEEGQLTLGARYLFDVVKELPNKDVVLTTQDNHWATLECDKAIFNLVGLSADDFPTLPSCKDKNFHTINAKYIHDMIEKTIFSVSSDETRYQLNGVYFEKVDDARVRMVATDGHRLSMIDQELKLDENLQGRNVIIPKKGIIELKKLLERESQDGTFELGLDGSNIVMRQKDVTLFIRLIEGEYPDYKQVIPQASEYKIEVSRAHLSHALKRISLLSDEGAKGVKFSFSPSLLVISSNNPKLGQAEESVDVKYKGLPFEIGFNAKYFLDILNVIENDEVSLELSNDTSPGVLKPVGDVNYQCVVMPMKI
ncbi:MAG: DNA polymerase III subunit beta [Deltaproteobacteria bacterium]|nr:DNA polymerase III subunit beta [Deltaproteobacteria bacterium]